MDAEQDDGGDLSERERQVLQALVDAHIQTAEPVGSKSLAQLSDLGVSPATIRNVLAALHERGMIEQPHTSAGRIPTDRGFRYYVDCLVRLQPPPDDVKGEITGRIAAVHGAVDDALREASKVLTRLSRHTTVIVSSRTENARLKHVELVRLRDDAVLLILVTVEGKVHNRLLEWRDLRAPDAAVLERASNRITELVHGRTLDEAREALTRSLDDLERRVVAALRAPDEPDVHVEGTAHLLAGAADVERTRELLALLEEGARVKDILDAAALAPGIRIFIGEENPSKALYERGLVAAPLGPSGALGVLGVIGPRHLDYGRVVPLVDLTAQVVTRALQG